MPVGRIEGMGRWGRWGIESPRWWEFRQRGFGKDVGIGFAVDVAVAGCVVRCCRLARWDERERGVRGGQYPERSRRRKSPGWGEAQTKGDGESSSASRRNSTGEHTSALAYADAKALWTTQQKAWDWDHGCRIQVPFQTSSVDCRNQDNPSPSLDEARARGRDYARLVLALRPFCLQGAAARQHRIDVRPLPSSVASLSACWQGRRWVGRYRRQGHLVSFCERGGNGRGGTWLYAWLFPL